MPIIDAKACQCSRCGRVWIPVEWGHKDGHAGKAPRTCPECKNTHWDELEVAPVGRPKKESARAHS